MGSELRAASGRGSEVSEWPRSKLGASAVRQRRNFGHRNRSIGPYGGYKECVGEGLSCPPLCRPTDGHCRARQSGHFLETGSLHPPLAALRRFPRPRATARVAPTEGLPIGFRRGRRPRRPASFTRGAVDDRRCSVLSPPLRWQNFLPRFICIPAYIFRQSH